MSVKNKTNKNYKRSQKGRSMVEMLGVLAIIGVLSVGGISAYGVAMKKHKANELLHQASMIATTVSAKIMTGKTLADIQQGLSNFSDGSHETALSEDGTKFILTLKDVDSGACEQLKKGGVVRDVKCVDGSNGAKDAQFTFYKNLATNDIEGAKGPTPPYDDNAGAKACDSDDDCAVGCQRCSDEGKCVSVCDLGEYCGDEVIGEDDDGYPIFGYSCKGVEKIPCDDDGDCGNFCCATDGFCVIPDCGTGFWYSVENVCYDNDYNTSSGTCSADSHSCTSNVDCEKGEYCDFHTTSSELTAGTCFPLGTINTVSLDEDDIGSEYNGYTYSDTWINWWGADNWCKAQGMRLVSLSDLGCSGGGSDGNGTCSDWDALQTAFGSDIFWTNDTSFNALTAYVVGEHSAFSSSRFEDYPVICRK